MIFDIRDYGAINDGVTLCTEAIQAAIDACAEAGGGRVLIEGGKYLTGSLTLRSFVELHLAANAILQASTNTDHFPERADVKHVDTAFLPRARNASILFAEEAEGIAITGQGIIDCGGDAYMRPIEKSWMPYARIDAPTPPRVVFFTGCRNIKVCDITMRNQPAGWSYWIHDCDFVTFDSVKIDARLDYPNNDGIHVNCSRNVTISNCMISCADDCIVVRANSISLKENKPCEKVVVTNCTLTTWCNAIRIGWINDGTIRNCTFSNLTITDSGCGIGIVLPERGATRLLDEGREATLVENLTFDNIIFDRGRCTPVWISVHENPVVKCDAIRNIYFSNMHCRSMEFPFISGRKANPLKNIQFSNCTFEKYPISMLPENYRYGVRGQTVFGKPWGNPLVMRYAENIGFHNTSFVTQD